MASVDSLHSNLKVVRKPLGVNYGKAHFRGNETWRPHNYLMGIP